jgi:isocitrate dehydrogenase (NAD+)
MDKVNPAAVILSGMLMLRHLGEMETADRLENAFAAVIKEGKYTTYDMRENRDDPTAAKCSEFADAIIRELDK